MKTFTVTKDHIKLLKRAYVGWNDCETGAPSIDPKRPYGNSYVVGDVAEILGCQADEYSEAEEIRLMDLHRGTLNALQIFLATGKLKAGKYEQAEQYDATSWRLVK